MFKFEILEFLDWNVQNTINFGRTRRTELGYPMLTIFNVVVYHVLSLYELSFA